MKNIEELYSREEFALAAKIRDTYSSGYAPVALCSTKRVSSQYYNHQNFTLRMWYAIQVWSRAVTNIAKVTSRCYSGVKDAFSVEWKSTKPFRTLVYTNYVDWDYARITEQLWNEIRKIADSGEIRVCPGTFYNRYKGEFLIIKIYDAAVLPTRIPRYTVLDPVSTKTRTYLWDEIKDLFVEVPFRVQELIHGKNLNPCRSELEKCWRRKDNPKELLHVMAKTSATFDEVKYAVEVLHCDVNEQYGNDAVDLQGLTPLNMCLVRFEENERRQVLDYLLSKGADINFFGYGGHSVLEDAVLSENVELLKYLLERGANPNYNGHLDEIEEHAIFSQIKSHALYMADCDRGKNESGKNRKLPWSAYESRCVECIEDIDIEADIAQEMYDILIQHGAELFVDKNQNSLDWSVYCNNQGII
ncbi:MAG: ankyrin repeat domain-containing protein [Bacteroidales bacterium]|nr:ankyrin repeat domain-containing protein [Bacteroidales bacterium]